ncbi:ubiquinol-cytochrome c reductase cytochrome c subunit [Friedmanniella endophytica]|uniref:Cytochrome bc1 complex cytochrome c subunit n=1 Tax=Microlunatus kandeliicorticis TaxID=1759536 RepID=A0A7W3ISG5_9ACTN|nr:ubiquinol-cytochrome c reductase cytochrome c subunit [Microlunatus kandeliicorticis]
MAKPLLLVFALFVMGGLYAILAPSDVSSADTTKSQQVEAGRKLFAVGCSSCHGLNGQGSSQGPTLVGVGAAAVDFQVSTGRMPLAYPQQQAPQTKVSYNDDEIAALAAYVQTLGPGPEIPSASQYQPSGLTDEEVARGGELFRTNCSACHNAEGAGGALPNGKYAPSLVGVSDKHIYEAMLTGPQQMPVFSDQVVTPKDKQEIIAYLQTLHERPNNGGLALGGIGPVSEGLWTWIVGLGVLVAFAVWIAAKGAKAK